jgi:hypothetical protein
MKTIIEIEQDILDITMKIQKEFPEISKYSSEMPVKTSDKDSDDVHIKNLNDYYNSLVVMIEKYAQTHDKDKLSEPTSFEGYPLYPPADDIYNKGKKESEFDPADLSKNKSPNVKAGVSNEKDFEEDMSGDDLDVPGSELDDQQESIGSEDEENNYYSLGGDDHNDLEEDKG